jgi:hypothetical protein
VIPSTVTISPVSPSNNSIRKVTKDICLSVYLAVFTIARWCNVGDEPGNLPLLEHALLQLWERRQGNTITHKAYNDIESLSGALKNHADRVYDELKDPLLQDIARRIFLDLTQLGERSEDTRRRVRKADLLAVESAEAERVLKSPDRRSAACRRQRRGVERNRR